MIHEPCAPATESECKLFESAAKLKWPDHLSIYDEAPDMTPETVDRLYRPMPDSPKCVCDIAGMTPVCRFVFAQYAGNTPDLCGNPVIGGVGFCRHRAACHSACHKGEV